MMKNVEILAPAGSYESLKAAIAAGADAVYIGGTRFGARAYADNLDEQKMLQAIDYVHLHGKKIYLTINTLLKENELERELYDYLLPYYRQGIDAVIVQDIGVLSFVKKFFPDLPIHASTQMTITDVAGAKFLEEQGVERVVTSREMHIDEIKEIAEQTDLEIESFVHGALCYCYSGQCLYSSLVGGRSGNRGQCAQPCRLPYKVQGDNDNKYILSLKDICTLEYIPQLIETGIHSFKIEGRMKKPEYVALVTAMYRKYIDLYFKNGKRGFYVDPKDKEKLLDLYNRGGFHGGYYYTNNGKEMISLERPNHAGVPVLQVLKHNGKTVIAKAIGDINAKDVIELPDGKDNYTFANAVKKGQTCSFQTYKKQNIKKNTVLSRIRNESLLKEIQDTIINKKAQQKIKGELYLACNAPARLQLACNDVKVLVEGDVLQEALNQPMDNVRVDRQMRKTGNTEFVFDTLEIKMDGNLFIPMQSLNELRRKGIAALQEHIVTQYRRNNEKSKTNSCEFMERNNTKKQFHVYIEEEKQWKTVLEHESVARIYVDANVIRSVWNNPKAKQFIENAHKVQKEIYLALPHVFRSSTKKLYQEAYSFWSRCGWDGILIRNYESFAFLKEMKYQGAIVTDYSLYQFNRYAKKFWVNDNQIQATTAPLELNVKELQEVGLEQSELVVYGYFPMMISAQCIVKTMSRCKKHDSQGANGRMRFVDRCQKMFVAKNHCDYCYNVIYNTAPVLLTDQKDEINSVSPKALRLHFTIEDETKVKEILDLYECVFIKEESAPEIDLEFTRGHFKRGIK